MCSLRDSRALDLPPISFYPAKFHKTGFAKIIRTPEKRSLMQVYASSGIGGSKCPQERGGPPRPESPRPARTTSRLDVSTIPPGRSHTEAEPPWSGDREPPHGSLLPRVPLKARYSKRLQRLDDEVDKGIIKNPLQHVR